MTPLTPPPPTAPSQVVAGAAAVVGAEGPAGVEEGKDAEVKEKEGAGAGARVLEEKRSPVRRTRKTSREERGGDGIGRLDA